MYPMGIDRWKPTSCSSSGVDFGTSNATDGISLSWDQMCMYASARSTLLRKAGPSLGGAARMQSITLQRAFSNALPLVGCLGDCLVEATLGEFVDEAVFSASLLDGCEGGEPESG